MRLTMLIALLLSVLRSGPVDAAGDRAGDFDYYVLALSWSPNWCVSEGDARDAPQCRDGARAGWTVHGLWPQYARGYPSDCRTAARDPSRSETAAMADVMGDGGAAWYQWRKHGRCSGLDPADYFGLVRRASKGVTRPQQFRALPRTVTLPASVVEEAWIAANPEIARDGLTVTCSDGRIQEVRICLTKALAPTPCGADVRRDCTLGDAVMAPLN